MKFINVDRIKNTNLKFLGKDIVFPLFTCI